MTKYVLWVSAKNYFDKDSDQLKNIKPVLKKEKLVKVSTKY